MNELTETIA